MDGAYVVNPDEYSDIELIGLVWTCKIMLLILILLDLNIFQKRSEHLSVIKTFLELFTNIFWIQAYDSIISRYFCVGFTDFMLAGKTLTDFANLFLPNNFRKNGDIILNYFMTNL